VTGVHVVHGLKLSYFTGKLEAYFRVKGIAYRFVEMDLADFRACARATGIAQMPQVERPDGTWETDTTAILSRIEDRREEPRLRPETPVASFCSRLLEDCFDEWLWRPALYYRWAFADDSALLSAQLARTLLRGIPAPFWLRRRFIRARQRREFLRRDGVTNETRSQIESLYHRTIDALEPIFAKRPFLFGARPCEADFGLFGPFFRHFSHDPTPAAILRERGPHTLAWTARLWATRAEDIAGAARIDGAPEDLAPLLEIAAEEYLPYLAANEAAVRERRRDVRYASQGIRWSVPSSPYRAYCLEALRAGFQELSSDDRAVAGARIGSAASDLLAMPAAPARTKPRDGKRGVADRNWRSA
jgi:glutathione S-transferase